MEKIETILTIIIEADLFAGSLKSMEKNLYFI